MSHTQFTFHAKMACRNPFFFLEFGLISDPNPNLPRRKYVKNLKLLSVALIAVAVATSGCGKKEDADLTSSAGSSEPSTQAAGPAKEGSAVLKGKVTLEGTAPAREKIAMDADAYCKSNHQGSVESDAVLANADGTLQNVFVYVKEGISGSYPAPTTPLVFDQHGCMYTPHVFGIQVDQPFKIINSDETLHNVHAQPEKSTQFNLAMPFKGMELTKKFSKPEVMVKIKCDVHPWMSAFGGVLPHPFFSVTGANGSFEISKLPPGTYTIEAWHEKFGAQTQSVTIGDGESKEISFAFKA